MRCKADPDQAQRDNRSNQLNPNNPNYQVMEVCGIRSIHVKVGLLLHG